MTFQLDSKGAKACKFCRSRQELSNEYLLAKVGFDTAENEPLKVCQKFAKHLPEVRIKVRKSIGSRAASARAAGRVPQAARRGQAMMSVSAPGEESSAKVR